MGKYSNKKTLNKKTLNKKSKKNIYNMNGGGISKDELQEISNNTYNLDGDNSIIRFNDKNIDDYNFISFIKSLKTNDTIQYIFLDDNNIGDKGAKSLAKLLEKNSNLKQIFLRNNQIGDEGANAILNSLNKNKVLITINIMNNKISNKCNKELNKNERIKSDKYNENNDDNDNNISKIKFDPTLLNCNSDVVVKENIEFIKNKVEFKPEFKINFDDKITQYFESYDKFNSLIKNNYDNGIKNSKSLPFIDNKNVKVLINLHGKTISSFFKLPDNVNVVFLSPVGYFTYISTEKFGKYINTNNGEKMNHYLNDPNCYNKSSYHSFFNESVIYYGGQYCIDLTLSREDSVNKEKVTGIYIYDKDTDENKFSKDPKLFDEYNIPKIIDPLLPYLEETMNTMTHYKSNNNLSKDKYENTLSNFLLDYFSNKHNKDKQFTIFFTSCRELDNQKHKNELVFYEQLIKALNFKIQYDITPNILSIDEEYKKCKYNSTHMSLDRNNNMSHLQNLKTINNIKQNNISSGNKIIIDDNSKLYLNDNSKIYVGEPLQKLIKNMNDNNYYILFSDLKSYITEEISKINKNNNKKLINMLITLLFQIIKNLFKIHINKLNSNISYYEKNIIYNIIDYLFKDKNYSNKFKMFIRKT